MLANIISKGSVFVKCSFQIAIIGRIIIGMEGQRGNLSCGRMWQSQGKFKLDWSQSFRDTMQMDNRLKILQLEKQFKIKEIQKKLDQHKRNVELKITKFNRHRDVDNMHAQERMNVTMYYNHFQQDKKDRQTNIRNLKDELSKSRNREFWSVKKEREENLKKISEERIADLEEKIGKRNKIRMMEIQCKQNIVSSWNRKLMEMKQGRKKLLGKKVKEHDQNLALIGKMQKREKKILEDIYKADQMERQIGKMINVEQKMNGDDLSKLYRHN